MTTTQFCTTRDMLSLRACCLCSVRWIQTYWMQRRRQHAPDRVWCIRLSIEVPSCGVSTVQAQWVGSRATVAGLLLSPAVPALAGRTALQAYTDLMSGFRDKFSHMLGTVVTDADIGLGPKGEFRYPSTPLDSRWNFPGIGEFQVGVLHLICQVNLHASAACRVL
eukprot:GHUV01016492.1.p1 GENE.GHUV01016492.1~~GHUV01016492.1.p1  ORF type:complete len:165 (+),score=12.69 GHUV01016492.1:66-560(+)